MAEAERRLREPECPGGGRRAAKCMGSKELPWKRKKVPWKGPPMVGKGTLEEEKSTLERPPYSGKSAQGEGPPGEKKYPGTESALGELIGK